MERSALGAAQIWKEAGLNGGQWLQKSFDGRNQFGLATVKIFFKCRHSQKFLIEPRVTGNQVGDEFLRGRQTDGFSRERRRVDRGG